MEIPLFDIGHLTFDILHECLYHSILVRDELFTLTGVEMSPGEKVWMRVKPRELMACVDVLRAAGVDINGVGVSGLVRLALAVLIESAVKAKQIPDREGFEYLELITPFKRANIRTKVQVGHAIRMAELERESIDKPTALGVLPAGKLTQAEVEASRARTVRALAEDDPQAAASLDRKLRRRVDPRILRRDELRFKSEQDPANMSQKEFKELNKLTRELAAA